MLAGQGVITGNVFTASSSRLAPGAAGSPGTLTFANQLALNDGTALDFNLNSTTNTGGGINDLIAVAGDLVLNGRDRKSTRLNSSHQSTSRMPSSA